MIFHSMSVPYILQPFLSWQTIYFQFLSISNNFAGGFHLELGSAGLNTLSHFSSSCWIVFPKGYSTSVPPRSEEPLASRSCRQGALYCPLVLVVLPVWCTVRMPSHLVKCKIQLHQYENLFTHLLVIFIFVYKLFLYILCP